MSALASGDWVGWVIGVIAVTLAIVFHFKTRVSTKLAYQWSGRHLVGGSEAALPDEVAISYCGISVPRLSSSQIIFWNCGNTTVRGTDIVKVDPLRIARVHAKRQNEALCTFDYLDPGDGARLEILHTGEKGYPELTGSIRGIPKGPSDWGAVDRFASPFADLQSVVRLGVIGNAAFGLAVILYAVFVPILQAKHPIALFWPLSIEMSKRSRLAMILAGVVYALPGAFVLWVIRRRFPRVLCEDNEATAQNG